MTDKDMYIFRRRKQKIRLIQIAESIGCSASLLSKYENDSAEMSEEKIAKYKEYINLNS